MAIEVACPQCEQKYKLKDELAGKKISCKKCLTAFRVPGTSASKSPATTAPAPSPASSLPADAPLPNSTSNGHTDPVDADALALSALADEPPPPEVAKPEGKPIKLTCGGCDHQWEVPRAMEGKNVLCPECQYRMRVPVQVEEKPKDWRTAGKNRPSLAKNDEKLEGAWDTQAKVVGAGTLKEAGAIVEAVEPLTLTERLRKYSWMVALVLIVVFVGMYARRSMKQNTARNYMAEAVEEFERPEGEAAKRPTWLAAIKLANAEYLLLAGIDNDADRTKTFNDLLFARNKIHTLPPSTERNRLLIAIAARMADLGGDREAVREEEKLDWRKVQTNMRQTLAPLAAGASDFDTKLDAVREVTRALAPKGQFAIVKAVVNDMFGAGGPAEQAEVLATVGIELFRLGMREQAETMAKDSLLQVANPQNPGVVARSMQALANALEMKLPPNRALPAAANLTDDARAAFAMGWALKGDPDQAKSLAERQGSAASRFRALVMSANLLPPEQAKTLALAAAKLALNELKPKPNENNTVSPTLLLQLSRILASCNEIDSAMLVAETIKDANTQTWARYEILRARLEANPSTRAEEVWLEKIGDGTELGVAMAHLTAARHNELLGDPNFPRIVDTWSEGVLRPFGWAGRALAKPVLLK